MFIKITQETAWLTNIHNNVAFSSNIKNICQWTPPEFRNVVPRSIFAIFMPYSCRTCAEAMLM